MTSQAGSDRVRIRLHLNRIAAVALTAALGIAWSHQPVLAAVQNASGGSSRPQIEAPPLGSHANDAGAAENLVVVADKGHKGNKNGNKGNNNSNKNWSNNGKKNWNKNWSHNNNNWNKNWNKLAYVRNWSDRPYYGEFIGGIILGSILAANGVGIVPYAPEPYLCWYWADPYMYRGYWDYCY